MLGRGRAIQSAIVLHEDQVPNLHPAAPIDTGFLAERCVVGIVAVEVMDLGARTARAGRAHAPEVVGHAEAPDAVVAEPGDFAPQRGGLVIGRKALGSLEHGQKQAIRRNAEDLR